MKKPFYLHFNDSCSFKKGEILTSCGNGEKVKIIKVYRNTRWRRFLAWLGFNMHPNNALKVISIDHEKERKK